MLFSNLSLEKGEQAPLETTFTLPAKVIYDMLKLPNAHVSMT